MERKWEKRMFENAEWNQEAEAIDQELSEIQEILDNAATKPLSDEEHKNLEHFQNRLFYYKEEVVPKLIHDIREEIERLANLDEHNAQPKSDLLKKHRELRDEISSLSKALLEYNEELGYFIKDN